MKRKKTNVNLIAIVLSLIAILTTHAKAATTFYEVWRSETPDISTSQIITNSTDEKSQWITTNNFIDNTCVSGVIYYYWVRSFKADIVTEVNPDEYGALELWYATEASNAPIAEGYTHLGWPFRCVVHVYDISLLPGYNDIRFSTSVWESDDLFGGAAESVNLGSWPLRTEYPTQSHMVNERFIEETKRVDLFSKAQEGGESDPNAEVFAKSVWSWGPYSFSITIETEVQDVDFINLKPAPTNFTALAQLGPNQITLSWDETPLQTTTFSQMVSVRLPKTIYVNHVGTPSDPNGSSWETAYIFLQDALQEARYNDIIYVASPSFNNAYYPTQGNDRTVTFNIPNGVKIYGGFPTNGGDPNQRDPESYPTTLSGKIYIDNDINDNSHHVVTISGCDTNTVLDGFVIESGYSDGSIPNDRGAGIYITNSDVIIKNCIIAGNSGLTGSGIYCGQSNPAIINCLFWDNYSEKWGGAGLYNEDSNTIVLNSKFILNKTDISIMGLGGNGGAIYNERSNISMTNCELKCNTAKRDGGGIYNYDSMPKLTNCTLSGNIADVNGGGLFDGYNSSTEIKNSILWNNGDPEPLNEYSQFHTEATTPLIFHSCIQDEVPGDGTLAFNSTNNNNIDLNPLFVNDPNPGPDGLWNGTDDCIGNLKLRYSSPCIEVGNNSYLPTDSFDLDDDGDMNEPVSIDLADHLRLIDRNRDFIATVDMGAYERGVCPGNPNFDGSGLVNFADFAMFAAKWLDIDCDCHGSCCDGTDLNSDEIVDFDDLEIFVDSWLENQNTILFLDFDNLGAVLPSEIAVRQGAWAIGTATDFEGKVLKSTGYGHNVIEILDVIPNNISIEFDFLISYGDIGDLNICLNSEFTTYPPTYGYDIGIYPDNSDNHEDRIMRFDDGIGQVLSMIANPGIVHGNEKHCLRIVRENEHIRVYLDYATVPYIEADDDLYHNGKMFIRTWCPTTIDNILIEQFNP